LPAEPKSMPINSEPIHNNFAPRVTTEYGFPVREDVAFTNAKGEPKAAIEKTFRKIVSSVAAPLQRVLEPGETIFWASKAMPPVGTLEQLTMNWVMLHYYNVGLVFTDRRLLIFGLTSSYVWRGSIKSVRWSEVVKAKASGWLTQALSLKIGKKTIAYGRLGYQNAKKIKTLLPFLTAANPAAAVPDPLSATQPIALCPRCSQQLTASVYTCAHCGLVFKDEKTLALRTLIPGGGYFYTGLTGVGILNVLAEAFFLLALVGTLLDPESAGKEPSSLGIVVAYLLFLIGLEKIICFFHARKFVRQFEPSNIADVNIPAAMSAVAH
jgi:hypothetical protein